MAAEMRNPFATARSRQFVAYFHYVGWSNLSLGFHINVRYPNLELHLPAGFIKVGWVSTKTDEELAHCRSFGLKWSL